jgi:tRNA pseudouridine55 synthase
MDSGIILVDKPSGMSSAAVVARVKRALKAERVGHAGTLDPDATGLLVILVNGATRVASFAADGMKRYTGRIRLGVRTTTDDLTGEVISTSEAQPPEGEISRAARAFVGPIQQVPPRVSAIKVQGRRAYDLTRKGHSFDLAAREVTVYRFDLKIESPDTLSYVIECSPGTYVRSLARDLGDVLGCGAAVESIRRDASGALSVASASPLEEVSWNTLQDWARLVPEIPRVEVSHDVAQLILNGHQKTLKLVQELPSVRTLPRNSLFLYGCPGVQETLGILRISPSGEITVALNIGRCGQQKGAVLEARPV